MYPHERSLVKKMEGKPFVLLGVNSDPKKRLKDVLKKENITWRSWWDGGSTGGPIARNWVFQGWPTLYIIDHKGVIRHSHVGSPGEEVLDAEIEKLVREAQEAQKAAK
jgi:hypothetical protein